MTLTEPDRLKFEWMQEQAKLKAAFYAALLAGEAFVRQQQDFNGSGAWGWNDVRRDYLEWDDERTYCRKPEPKIIPYDFETCPLGAHVAWKGMNRRATIGMIYETSFTAGTWAFTFAGGLAQLEEIPDTSKPNERRPFGREVA